MEKRENRMYENVKTWNPFKGCEFNCEYCKPSFQRQAKRQKHLCEKCYNYEPHFHPERLKKIPSCKLIFACGNGDIYFATSSQRESILEAMRRREDKVFMLQSKNPVIFHELDIPDNCVVGTTVETNYNYNLSKAPQPVERYKAMCGLDARKYVTIEPILTFDLEVMARWMRNISPEFVYIGYDNHKCRLPEPPLSETLLLIDELEKFTEVRLKTIKDAWWQNES